MNYIAEAIKPLLALLIVLALHALVLWQVVQQAPEKRVVQAPKPIMINLITPPKPPSTIKALPVALKKGPVAKPKPKRIKVKKPKRIKVKKPKRIKVKKPKQIKVKKPKQIKVKKPKQIKVKKVANSLRAIHQKVSATPQESATKGSTAARSSRGQRKNGGGVTRAASYKAVYLHNPYPPYPRISRRRGEEGKVSLRVKVTKNGRAASVQLKKSSGSRRLDKAARKAVSKWRFVPAKKNGKTVTGWVIVPIVFKLN
ncbi:MAG: energy transducer TonB [Pseudomonadota bacterium]